MDVAVRTSTDLFWMRYRNGARGGVREVFFRSQHCYTLSRHARPLVSGRRTSPSPPHIASDTDTRPSLSTYIKFAVYCHTGGGGGRDRSLVKTEFRCFPIYDGKSFSSPSLASRSIAIFFGSGYSARDATSPAPVLLKIIILNLKNYLKYEDRPESKERFGVTQ